MLNFIYALFALLNFSLEPPKEVEVEVHSAKDCIESAKDAKAVIVEDTYLNPLDNMWIVPFPVIPSPPVYIKPECITEVNP